jgi:hypothetical protein
MVPEVPAVPGVPGVLVPESASRAVRNVRRST